MKKVLSVLALCYGSMSYADIVDKVVFEGLDRVDVEAVSDCITITPHKEYSADELDESYKALFQKGFFSDIKFSKRDNVLVVKCTEKPMIDKVAFEGNDAIKSEDIKSKIASRIGEGKLYDLYVIKDILADMQLAYKSLGYLSVTIVPKIIKHPGNKIDIVFEINEHDKTTVKKIVFIGNTKFNDEELKDIIVSKEEKLWRFWDYNSHVYSEDRTQVDVDHITEFYKNNGYPFVVVRALPSELSFDKKSVYCTFQIEEGAEYKLSGFSLDSQIAKISPDDYKKLINLKKGDIYNLSAIEANRDNVRKDMALKDNPFTDVDVDIKYDNKNKTAQICYSIVETPKTFIERIEIVGNVRTLDRVIRREFTVHEGDPFNTYKIQKTVEKLNGLDYFDDVQISDEPGSAEDKKVLFVKVKEKEAGTATLRFGLSVSDADGFGGFIGFTESNLMGTGRILSLDGYWAQKLYGCKFGLYDPRFLDHNFGAGIMISGNRYDRKKYDDSVLRSLSIEPYIRYNITENLSHRVGYDISFNSRKWWDRKNGKLLDKVPDDAKVYLMREEFGKYTRSEIRSTLFYDQTDNPYNPRAGYDLSLTNSFAGLGGCVRYLKNELEGTYYHALGKRFTFLANAKIGYMHESRNTRSSDRYALGGTGTELRGFDSYGVGPRDRDDNSVGGNKFWSVSFMVKTPLSSRDIGINGLAFVDLGSAWGSKYDKKMVRDSSSIRASTGIAIQWARSPFGMPLSLIFAVPLKKQNFDETQRFTLGNDIQ